jgi:cytoskeletal protein RodZ
VTPLEFGEKLRRQRESLGITLDRIAATTKIGRRLLAALEAGDGTRWPPGIYGRSYVRLFAAEVGLDPEELVGDFAACFPQVAWPDGPPQPANPVENAASVFEPRAGRVAGRRLAGDTV